jgi:autotransporter-associated beta strand protein
MTPQKSLVRGVARAIARFFIGSSVTMGLLFTPSPAAAANCVWTGAGGDARWSNPANWTDCPGPANGDVLYFPAGATPVSVNDIADLLLKGILIEGFPNVSNYVIMGAGVTMEAEGNVSSSQIGLAADGQAPTIALPIAIAPALPGFTSRLHVYVVTLLNMTGAITGNETSVLRKVSIGALNLGSPDNAWNTLVIEDGDVRVGVAGALPANSGVQLTTLFARLDLNGIDAGLRELAVSSGPVTPRPSILLGTATLTVGAGAINGGIAGSGGLVKTGPGQLILGGTQSNSYTGATIINGGTLVMMKEGATGIAGPVIVNGGQLSIAVAEQIADTAAVTLNGSGSLSLDHGADETIGSLAGSGPVTLGAATLRVGVNGNSTTFAGNISGLSGGLGRVSLAKVGTGTLTLTGAHTYEGSTRIETGTLLVNGSIGPGAPNVELFGGTLGGVGSLTRIYAPVPTTTVSPGTSPGILHATGAYIRGAYAVEIHGPIAGSGHDQLDVTQDTVDVAGATLQISLTYNPPAGTAFTIVKQPAGPSHAVLGAFAGLPEGAELLLREQRFDISYRGGEGNDIVLTALEGPPAISIDDVTVTEGNAGTTEAVFTVALSHAITGAVGVQYTIESGTAAAPADYTAQSGTLLFLPGTTTQSVTVAVTGDRDVEPDETFAIRLWGLSGVLVSQGIVTIAKTRGTGTIASDDVARTYVLAEGATGSFFDTDILIANPNGTIAPVTLTFLKQDGEQVMTRRSIDAWSHLTVHADLIPGLESTAASATVTSESGVPLMVERTMFWDAMYRAGHTGSSVEQPSRDWLFAEGSQGFFSTFVLVANPHDTATDVTFTFLLETGDPIVVTRTVGPTARLTLGAGEIPELVDRSFGIAVHATQPIMVERSMYFGTASAGLLSGGPWSGGTESAGVTSASTHWFLAEGATGDFFDTFILLSNPGSEPASVTLRYLLDFGEVITVPKVVPANGRLTIDIETESDARLHDAAVSTVVASDRPIIAERSMYWAGLPWREAHNSFGVVELGTRWALAEGRVGGARNFHTFVLFANPQTEAAHVTVTYLREEGAPLVRQYIVPPTSRFNIDVNAIVPEMHDESFGTLIEVTNGVPIAAERSMYWDAQGVFWSGGTNATGMRLP